MALHGKAGSFYKGTTKIAETTSWTLDTEVALVDVERHGDNWVSRIAGLRTWSGTVEALLSLASGSNQTTLTKQSFLDPASQPTISCEFRAADGTLSGRAWVSGFSASAPANDAQVVTFNVVGTGTLSQSLTA